MAPTKEARARPFPSCERERPGVGMGCGFFFSLASLLLQVSSRDLRLSFGPSELEPGSKDKGQNPPPADGA